MTTSPERIEEYLRLYGEGKTYREVGEVFGLTGESIQGALKNAGKLESRFTKISPKRLEEYSKLYREGKTYKQIGEVFGLTGSSIHQALKTASKLESRSLSEAKRKIPPERIEEYLKLYREGKSYREVAEVFELNWHSIRSALKAAGKLESRSFKIPPERIEEYLSLYREGKSYREIGEVFGLTGVTIRKTLKNAGKLESRSSAFFRKISPKRLEEYSKLYREGKTYEQIGEVFGLSGSSIHRALKTASKLESRSLSEAKRKKSVDLAVQKYSFGIINETELGIHNVAGACKRRGVKSLSIKEAAIKNFGKPVLAAEYWRWYEAGYSATEISEMYECSVSSVCRLLKNHGYKLRTNLESQKLAYSGKRLKPLAILPTAPKPLKPKQVAAKPKVDRTSKGLKLLNELTAANRTKT